jgi:hypothetical protein
MGLQAFLWIIWICHLDFVYHEDHEVHEGFGACESKLHVLANTGKGSQSAVAL